MLSSQREGAEGGGRQCPKSKPATSSKAPAGPSRWRSSCRREPGLRRPLHRPGDRPQALHRGEGTGQSRGSGADPERVVQGRPLQHRLLPVRGPQRRHPARAVHHPGPIGQPPTRGTGRGALTGAGGRHHGEWDEGWDCCQRMKQACPFLSTNKRICHGPRIVYSFPIC